MNVLIAQARSIDSDCSHDGSEISKRVMLWYRLKSPAISDEQDRLLVDRSTDRFCTRGHLSERCLRASALSVDLCIVFEGLRHFDSCIMRACKVAP